MLPIFISAITDPAQKEFYTDLYRTHYPFMLKTAYRVTKNIADAEDAVQDALLRLLGKYDTLSVQTQASRALYIKLTAQTAAIDAMRKRNRDYSWLLEGLDPEWTSSEKDNPENIYLSAEKKQALTKAIQNLPERLQEFLCFKFVLEKSNAELASLLGTTPANIRMILTRIRRKLYRSVEDI